MDKDNSFEILLKQAETAAVSGDFDLAEKILASQEAKDIAGKDNPRALFALGSLCMKAELFEEALSIFNRLDAIQPDNAQTLNRLGTIYRRMGELEKSLDVLLKARSLGDNSSELLRNLGNTYTKMYGYEDAITCLRKALEINPDDALAYNHIGTIEFLRGRYKNALDEYRNGLRVDPSHPFIHFNMARLYRLLGRSDDAESEFIAAIKSRPNWLKALLELSSFYKGEGALEKRSLVLARLLSIDSKSLPALLGSAENAEKLKEFANARDFFVRALAASAHSPVPAQKYARFLSSTGDFTKAATVIETYNEDNPDDKSLMLDLAEICLDARRDSDAEKILKEHAETNADDARTWQLLAKLHLERGNKAAAMQDLENVLSADPKKVEARKELAAQLAEVGLLEEAQSRLSLFSKDNPDDGAADMLLGAIYEEAGDFENALARYAKVIEREKDNMAANPALALLYQRMEKGDADVLLAAAAIAAQGAKHSGGISMLQESIDLFLQAASKLKLSNPQAAEKSLQALARIQNELKGAAKNALQAGGLAEAEEASAKTRSIEEGNCDISRLAEALQGTGNEAAGIHQETEEYEDMLEQMPQYVAPQARLAAESEEPSEAKPLEADAEEARLSPPQAVSLIMNGKKPGGNEPKWPANIDLEDGYEDEDEEEALRVETEKEEAQDEVAASPVAAIEEPAAVVNYIDSVGEYDILELLEYLKNALLFLPEEDQIKFRESDARMRMEYVTCKLLGKPGLHEKSATKSAAPKESEGKKSGIADLSETFSLLASLSAELPDKNLAGILGKRASVVQEKLKSLEEERPPHGTAAASLKCCLTGKQCASG